MFRKVKQIDCRYVEDDPVLRAIPYFGDNDNGRLDFLERGYERILDDAVGHLLPPHHERLCTFLLLVNIYSFALDLQDSHGI